MILRLSCLILISLTGFRVIQAQAPPVVRAGVVLTTGTSLPFDYNILAPALEAAFETSLTRYNVQYEPVLCLYQGGCSVSSAAGETHLCAYKNVDFLIGKRPQLPEWATVFLGRQIGGDYSSV